MTTADGRTVRFDGADFSEVTAVAAVPETQPAAAIPPPELAETVPALSEYVKLADGGYLAGSRSNGLYRVDADGAIIHRYHRGNSDLPDNDVRALLQDRQGRFWIGTHGGGLARMVPTGLRHYDRADGLQGGPIHSLYADPKNKDKIWIAASQRGIQYFDSIGFHQPLIDDPSRGTRINGIATDEDANTYFATEGRGVVILNDSLGITLITERSGLPEREVVACLRRKDGPGVWAITRSGGVAAVAEQDSVFSVAVFPELDSNRAVEVTVIIDGPNQGLLAGLADGRIIWWQEGRARELNPENGLPATSIRALALRRGTQLWVAAEGSGVYYTDLRTEPVRFVSLPERLGYPGGDVVQFTAPPDRPEIWFGTERGLDRLFLNANGQADWLRHYGRQEGFLGGAATEATTIDAAGNLWFGTTNGLVKYEDDDPNQFLAPPPTYLMDVNLFYTPVDSVAYRLEGGLPTFSPRENHFNFRYRAVDLTHPERIRYRYQLRGEDAIWSPLTTETVVRYAGLGAGKYEFLAEATTDGGNTWGAAATYGFMIEQPLVKRAEFLVAVTLLGIGLLVGLFYVFYHWVGRREAAKRRALEVRTELLELRQKALQLQMNPHFIFNALNGIRGLVDGQHDAEAREQISRFAGLMRGILNNSREELIPLADELKTLNDYLGMEQFCQTFSFTFTLHPPPGQNLEELSLPPMLIQPFVENAVLHGLSGRAKGGHIDVTFLLRGRRMQCLVKDNGIGRKAAAARQKQRTPTHKSVALDVTRSRLAAIGGNLDIEDNPEGGTIVRLSFPVETW